MPALADELSLTVLTELTGSEQLRDRAFAASALSLRPQLASPAERARLYGRVRETARAQHAELRARIRLGDLAPELFVAELDRTPLELRDHLIEEILDIAYPPLEQVPLPKEAVSYSPSGLAEILFVLAEAKLSHAKTFVDLGSGLGKVTLLVALFSGATSYGIELDPHLVAEARAAAASLSLDNARFIEGDLQSTPLPPADVYYMFIPRLRSSEIVARLQPLARERKLLLFSQALDLRQLPWLKRSGRGSYWLELYETRF
jgi:SAM-dependent methyltransferase